MRKFLNTLYIRDENTYLHRDGLNIVVEIDDEKRRFPIHYFENIILFNYVGMSPALMELCMENNVSVSFLSPFGKFRGKVEGPVRGNVLLRKEQYRISDDESKSLLYAKNFMIGKFYNQRFRLNRGIRDHSLKIDIDLVRNIRDLMTDDLEVVQDIETSEGLLGLEGNNAKYYFMGLRELILKEDETFTFLERTRRPPLDPVNALLSFGYTLLTILAQGALETVGLDPYVGFYHKDRPGRVSLALDIIEELRSYMVDSFILALINRRQFTAKDFWKKEDGAVLLTEKARDRFLLEWQKRLNTTINHPYLDETIELGLLPYVQSLLLARTIRKDIEQYPPFFCK